MRATFTSERKVSGFQEQQQQQQQQQQQHGAAQRSPSPRKLSGTVPPSSRGTSPTKQSTTSSTIREQEQTAHSQAYVTESDRHDHPEMDRSKGRAGAKPPLVRSETYEERCRKILGMPNRPEKEEDTKSEAKSIFSTYDNTVTVQQSRSELREQRKKIEQEIKSMESKTTSSLATGTSAALVDEQDSVVETETTRNRKTSSATKDSSPTRKLFSQQASPTRKPSSTPKEVSPVRKSSMQEAPTPKKSTEKEHSPSRKAPSRDVSPMAKEASPTKQQPKQASPGNSARMTPVKDLSPVRKSPSKDASPTRPPAMAGDVSPARKTSQPQNTTARKSSPVKETSPTRKSSTVHADTLVENDRVESSAKLSSETTTRSKATILVEQKKEGRNISVAEITIMPVMEVSESVRTKAGTVRTQEKVLTKQSSDTKFDRRSTSVANSRVITNKSSSDFDIKRRAVDVASQGKTRTPATSPDKRRPVVTASSEKSVPAKQNHITVAKIKIESMRKATAATKSTHGAGEEVSTARSSSTSNSKRTVEQPGILHKPAVEPETDPESSKDTGISDNSEVEEVVESVVAMNVTGMACCRHTDRKDSAPVYRTTGAARSAKSYTRSSSDNHLRSNNAATNRSTTAATNPTTTTPKSSPAGGRKVERPVKHVATKTINLSTKAVSGVSTLQTTCSSTLGSDNLDNVVIDIQLAKSSREPTPNKLVPIPVSPDTEDNGKPRYPDAVQEPDDDSSGGRPLRQQRVNNIPIYEEATNEYVGCEITEVDETETATSQQATRITNLDRVTEDDESLLSVTEKVNKFAQEARRLREPSSNGTTEPRSQTARFSVRAEYDDIDDHLKSDECLLSVSDKVTKFISTAEEVKKIRTSGPFMPENEDVPAKVNEGDECLLSVNEKVNRFASRMTRSSEAREQEAGRTVGGRTQAALDRDEEELEDEYEQDRTGTVLSESVNSKFVPQKSPELVKNAMRSTARHIVADATAEDMVQSSGSSIANRYRTATMNQQFEKPAPTVAAPCSSPITLRSTEAVKKAKEIFEKGQTMQDARQRDILNRPSVWEDRRNKQPQQQQQQQPDQKRNDVKLTDIGVTDRKTTQTVREEHTAVERIAPRKDSLPKGERGAEPVPNSSRRDSGSAIRPPAYIRDVVSTKKDMFEKRISSSKMQVEYTTQTSQEAAELTTSSSARKNSLKQQGDATSTNSVNRSAPSVDQSKPSYMNHTVASLEHINANQRRDSLDHGVAPPPEPTTARGSIGSAKFGVELKRPATVSTTTAQISPTSSKRKASTGDGQLLATGTTTASSPAIEEMFDLELLERMLESVTGYEQRRRIRAQIRVVKKQRETSAVLQTGKQTSMTSSKSVTSSHSTQVVGTRETTAGKRKDSSPTRASLLASRKQSETGDATDAVTKGQAHIEPDTKVERNANIQRQQPQEQESGRKASTSNVSTKTSTVTTERFASRTGTADRQPTKDDRPIWATSNILKKASENTRTFKSSSMTTSSTNSGGSAGGRKVVSSTTSSYQQTKTTNDPKTTTDCITSSYGVGPTDENGLPLFGIRALKKKAAPAPAPAETDTKISGTIVTETLYSENGGPAVGKRSTTHYSNEPGTFSDQQDGSKMMAMRKTETIDAAGMHTEEFEVMDGLEMAARREAKVVRKGSVKELTERFIHRESSGSLTQETARTYPKAGLILRSSAQSQSSRASTPATDGCSIQSGSVDDFEQEQMETGGVTTRQVRSFLNDTSKVVDVRDVLQRMSNADNVTEQGDTAEDQEARALLNKFLGASVLMSGVESMVSSSGSVLGEVASPSTTAGTKK
uniref:Smoothelin domain-containing protein n=1 Tax=Anopheles christyi TaxID=43041 RepID=A0A182KB13_9DIPT